MTVASLHGVTEAIVDARSRGETLLLLFDFDGTLSPTVHQSRQATLPKRTRQALARLNDLPRCRVGVISGRSLEELCQRVDIPGVFLAGSGGLERDCGHERLIEPQAEDGAAAIASLGDALAPTIELLPGARLERKPFGLTIHHHGASRRTVAAVRRLASALQVGAANFGVTICDLGVEISPCPMIHKGTAVRAFMAAVGGESVRVVYAGNDANDEGAMMEAVRRGGYAIGVGLSAPAAAHSLSGPHALTMWLESLAAELSR